MKQCYIVNENDYLNDCFFASPNQAIISKAGNQTITGLNTSVLAEKKL